MPYITHLALAVAALQPSGGRAPSGVQGQSEAPPPEAESILVIGCPTEPANLAPLVKFSNVHLILNTGQ